MAVVEYFPDEHSEAKPGANFIRTDNTLPRITGVFTARKDGCFIPYRSSVSVQQSAAHAAQSFETEPVAGERFREVNRMPWPRVGFAFECDRTSLNVIKSIPEVTPSSANVVTKDSNSFVCIEPGFYPTCNTFIPTGGLVSTGPVHPHTKNVLGNKMYYRAHKPEGCCMDEKAYTPLDRQRVIARLEMHPSSCLSRFDSLQKSIPCRTGVQHDHFKDVLNENFSETIELYKMAIKCGLNIQPLSPSLNQQGSTNSKLTFSWEHIKCVLESDTSTQMMPSSLCDLLDLHALTLIVNRKNDNIVSISGGILPAFGGQSYSFNLNSSADFVGSKPTGPSTQTQTQTKNVTSVPYGEAHMEAILRSSTAQLHSHGTKLESQRHHLISSPTTYQALDVKEQGEDDVYLGRYPCLRDVPHLSTRDRFDGRNTPSVSSEDSPEKSPDIIIRPRPPSESYDQGFEYEREDFHSFEPFSDHQSPPRTLSSTFAPNLDVAPTITSPTTEMLSLPSSDTSDNSGLHPIWRSSDSSPLSKTVASTPGFRPIVPKTEGSYFTLATTTNNGENFFQFIHCYILQPFDLLDVGSFCSPYFEYRKGRLTEGPNQLNNLTPKHTALDLIYHLKYSI